MVKRFGGVLCREMDTLCLYHFDMGPPRFRRPRGLFGPGRARYRCGVAPTRDDGAVFVRCLKRTDLCSDVRLAGGATGRARGRALWVGNPGSLIA